MIKTKIKPCKGTGKAKGYGCSAPTLIRKYGLCKECLIKFYKENPREIKQQKEKKVKKKVTTETAKLNKALDTAWSKAVKIRGGNKCAYCGAIQTLNSHHIYSRSNRATRWVLENGICLCVNHHIGFSWSAHKTPIDFIMWLIQEKGNQFINMLRARSKQTVHYTAFEKKIMLKELNKYIEDHS